MYFLLEMARTYSQVFPCKRPDIKQKRFQGLQGSHILKIKGSLRGQD
jgi:hypothetical protein